ncbi:DUF222 domain-containing protein [Cryptosporangium sp. NPDC048952]|uniref:HNH endonuclease signature motif containing protein n=1 Tax=Cryptosporangium sp. NPDC048952 TaxID=3363961 RepID=UPI003716DBB7
MSQSELIAGLERITAGPELVTALAGIGPVRRRLVDAHGTREVLPDATEQVLVAQARQRCLSWMESELNRDLLQIAGEWSCAEDEDWGREEAATALRWSGQAMADRFTVARALAGRCVLTGKALAAGAIPFRHAVEIVHRLDAVEDDETAALIEAKLLNLAATKTAAQLGSRARREIAKADPAGADRRHKKARKGRRVDFTPLPDGMVDVRLIVPADHGARMRAGIDVLAGKSRQAGDTRTLDQRRADACVAAVELGVLTATGVLPAPAAVAGMPGLRSAAGSEEPDEKTLELVRTVLAGKRAVPPRIALTAPLSTVLGASDAPGELTGYGPVCATIVREVAADGYWEKWITDAGGVVTDLGRSTYRPSAELARLVRATYPTCVFPGCSMPSYRCDLDHNVRRVDGGETSAKNLVPLCRRHHRAKDEAGWQVVHDPATGACHWTSPGGFTYTVTPPDQSDGTDALTVPADWTTPLAPDPVPAGAPAPTEADDPPPF